MKELTFLTETASKQVEKTLVARDMSEPRSSVYAAYNSTLKRLTDCIVVQCVEYTMAMNPEWDRKVLFGKAREVQTKFINDTPPMNTPAGQEFGLKLAERIFARISPSSNPLAMDNFRSADMMDTESGNCSVTTSEAIELQGLFANLIKTEARIGEILTMHLGRVRSA